MIVLHEHIRLSDEEALLARLPEWRRAVALRFKHAEGRVLCAQAYLLLQEAFKQFVGHEILDEWQFTPEGKPFLSAYPDVHFNVSHCRKAVAVAVADRPIGVDVEAFGRYKESLAKHVLSAEECQLVQQSPSPDEVFTRLWTQKEALVKCRGTGITDQLSTILVDTEAFCLTTYDYPEAGFVLTVCEST